VCRGICRSPLSHADKRDDYKIAAGADTRLCATPAGMTTTSPGREGQGDAVLAPEADLRPPAADRQDFMRGTVVMVEIEKCRRPTT